ncbi:MAG: hypothetical protein C4523_10325 [Myxococcales bacterium]|nr:MAG: hypothetical protein C4523_10325 [Myxococcales bacterium]
MKRRIVVAALAAVVFLAMNGQAWAYTHNFTIWVEFADGRTQNVSQDLLEDPVSGDSQLPNYCVNFRYRYNSTWYTLTMAIANDDGYASKSISLAYVPDRADAIIKLEDCNASDTHRWIVTDVDDTVPDQVLAAYITTPPPSGSTYNWDFSTIYYATSGDKQVRAEVHATTDHFYDTVITTTSLLQTRWGIAGSSGTEQMRFRVDPYWNTRIGCGEMDCDVYEPFAAHQKTDCRDNDRTSHELGHSVMCALHKGTDQAPGFLPFGVGVYCWPIAGSCTEQEAGQYPTEWGRAAYVEGFADFVATAARWAYNTTNTPAFRGYNMEGVDNPSGDRMCESYNNKYMFRHSKNFARYLWDLYDDHNDISAYNLKSGIGGYSDSNYIQIFTIFNEMASFHTATSGTPNRYQDNGCDEREDQTSSGYHFDQPNPRDEWWHLDDYLVSNGYTSLADWSTKMYYMNCLRVWWNDAVNGTFRWYGPGRSPFCLVDANCPGGQTCNASTGFCQ